jgi:hypothetical protein
MSAQRLFWIHEQDSLVISSFQEPFMSTSFTPREVDDGSYAPGLLALAAALDAATKLKGEVHPFVLSPEAAG